jgi:hypothetical protein
MDEMEKSLVPPPVDGSRVFHYKEDYLLFGLLVRHSLVEMNHHDALALYQSRQEQKPSLMEMMCAESESPEKIRKDLQTLLDLLSTPELKNYLPARMPLLDTIQLWHTQNDPHSRLHHEDQTPIPINSADTVPQDAQTRPMAAPMNDAPTQVERPAAYRQTLDSQPAAPFRLSSDSSMVTLLDATVRESLTIDDVRRIETLSAKLPLVGKIFNNHIILDKMGGGAQGDVYLAKQLSLNRYVALKKLNIRRPEDFDRFFTIFRAEAQTIARINHPNIVQAYDIFAEGGDAFFTMESINGKTVKELISNSGGAVPLDLVANMACQACSALSRTSEDHLVHRDIKPANMMLDQNGSLKIVDFGLAGAVAALQDVGGFAGTPLYAAPEQFDGQNLTPAVDQYALGVTFYEALTGVNPFKGQGLANVENLHKTHQPQKPTVLNPNLPREVDAVLLRMLAKNPADRFPNFDECYTAWSKILTLTSKKAGAFASTTATATLLGETLIQLGREEGKALTQRGVYLGLAWIALTAGTIFGNTALQRRGLHHWLDFAGNLGTAIMVFSLFCIFYVAAARRGWLPTIGSLRIWLYTHILTMIPAIVLVLLHSGNFLAGITPGPPQAKPYMSILLSTTLLITAISGSVGLLIFRALRRQIQIQQLGLRKSGELTPREAMMNALSAQLLSGWRLVHYPLAILFIALTILHIIVSLQFRGLVP